MSKTKAWMITAAVLIVAGFIIFAAALCAGGGNFDMFNTNKYETNTHEITDEFQNISVNTDTADIAFVLSEDGSRKVVCHEKENARHVVTVTDGTLSINSVKKKWYEYIGINFGTMKITVYLPRAQYGSLSVKNSTGNVELPSCFGFENADISLSTGNVKCSSSIGESLRIKTSTGEIRLTDITAGDVSLTVSTGKTELENVSCKSLSSDGDTGRITLKAVIVENKLCIKRSTGSVRLDGCDGDEIEIKTSTGSVSGTLLSEKIFFTDTSTGSVDVPKTVAGGICDIKTSTGDIKIEIVK